MTMFDRDSEWNLHTLKLRFGLSWLV